MLKHSIAIFLFIVTITASISCTKENIKAELTVSATSLSILAEGDTTGITILSNNKWRVTNAGANWLHLNQLNGNGGNETIQVISEPNTTGSVRNTFIVFNTGDITRRVTISQPSLIYPSYNTSPKAPDEKGMGSTAVELAAKISLGWNIGNTMEAPGGETGWGNPVITEDYIKAIKQHGFNAIRLPCAWNWHHVDNKSTARIQQSWLNRVKDVVGYCVNNDLYVLLNIHWDGGWLDYNINKAKQDSINAKQKAFWEQIATTMRDFDEHLMFAGANEPPVDNAEQMAILNSYHQTFINAVRSTGGKNSYRVLVVQGPSTDILKTYDLMSTLPNDKVANRMMVEVHNYTPFQFCLMDGDANWGKMFYYWGVGHQSARESDRNATWGQETDQISYLQKLKAKFVDKGIPVLLGEYGAYRRDGSKHVPLDLDIHNKAVDYWITFVTKQSKAHGVLPFWWDTGGALDRTNYTVKDQRTIDALKEGVK